jgi:hypothetical protein
MNITCIPFVVTQKLTFVDVGQQYLFSPYITGRNDLLCSGQAQ